MPPDDQMPEVVRARCTREMKKRLKEYGNKRGNLSEGQVVRTALLELFERADLAEAERLVKQAQANFIHRTKK